VLGLWLDYCILAFYELLLSTTVFSFLHECFECPVCPCRVVPNLFLMNKQSDGKNPRSLNLLNCEILLLDGFLSNYAWSFSVQLRALFSF
jgi:hypothetical protein